MRRSAVASVRPLRKSQELAPALALLASAHRSASPRAGSCAALPASVSMPETMWLERRPALQPLLRLAPARYFYVRDAGDVPDVLAREYAWYSSAVAGKNS